MISWQMSASDIMKHNHLWRDSEVTQKAHYQINTGAWLSDAEQETNSKNTHKSQLCADELFSLISFFPTFSFCLHWLLHWFISDPPLVLNGYLCGCSQHRLSLKNFIIQPQFVKARGGMTKTMISKQFSSFQHSEAKLYSALMLTEPWTKVLILSSSRGPSILDH